MIALILAAGMGERMLPLTERTHKCLLNIGSKTIIKRVIDGLLENNIRRIIIVTGYRDNELREYLSGEYKNISFEFIHNSTYAVTNNIYSLSLAFQKISHDDDLLLIELDNIFGPDVIKKIIASKNKNVALVDKYCIGMDGNVVEVVEGKISSIIPPRLQGDCFDFSDKYKPLNVYKFSKVFCNDVLNKILVHYSNAFDDNPTYEPLLSMLISMQKEPIYAEYICDEKWAEVDDPNDLKCAEFIFHPENRYDILQNSFGGYWNFEFIDFCFIRNMYFPNSSMISELKNVMTKLIHNYGSKQCMLDEKLSLVTGYKVENIHLLNGAAQIYPILQNYFKDLKALIPDPTFGEYTRIFSNAFTYGDSVGIEKNEVTDKINQAELVVFVNPNNPTGTELPTEWIYDSAAKNPDKIFIVDESFIEFSQFESIIPSLEHNELSNVIVIKSLSKSLGVPGVRLGYVYTCDKKISQIINDGIPIWNSNSIAEYFLEFMLKHQGSLIESYEQTISDREILISNLRKTSGVIEVYESGANFILVKISANAERLCRHLIEKHSLYLKDISDKFKDGGSYLRIAVRKPDDNDYLVSVIDNYEE